MTHIASQFCWIPLRRRSSSPNSRSPKFRPKTATDFCNRRRKKPSFHRWPLGYLTKNASICIMYIYGFWPGIKKGSLSFQNLKPFYKTASLMLKKCGFARWNITINEVLALPIRQRGREVACCLAEYFSSIVWAATSWHFGCRGTVLGAWRGRRGLGDEIFRSPLSPPRIRNCGKANAHCSQALLTWSGVKSAELFHLTVPFVRKSARRITC